MPETPCRRRILWQLQTSLAAEKTKDTPTQPMELAIMDDSQTGLGSTLPPIGEMKTLPIAWKKWAAAGLLAGGMLTGSQAPVQAQLFAKFRSNNAQAPAATAKPNVVANPAPTTASAPETIVTTPVAAPAATAPATTAPAAAPASPGTAAPVEVVPTLPTVQAAPPAPTCPADSSGGAGGAGGAGGGGGGSGVDWTQVPSLRPIPRPGNFFPIPTGEGYYRAIDMVLGNELDAPPRYPYPRYGLIIFPSFDLDFRYLDNPDNTETDWMDFLKRVHLGDSVLFSTGGDYRLRGANETNSRLFNVGPQAGKNNNYQLDRVRLYSDIWYEDKLRLFVEFIDANSYSQDLQPLITDRNHGDFLNLFVDLKLAELQDNALYFRAGRQELLYGSQRLVSPLEWANDRRTFQGLKTFWHSENLELDAFCVQPVLPNADHLDAPDHNFLFSGAWMTYKPAAGQYIDLYYLDLNNSSGLAPGSFVGVGPNAKINFGDANTNTIGGRYLALTDSGFLFEAESAYQFGRHSNQDISAYMATGGAGWHFADLPMNPSAWVYYDYASGDPNPNHGDYHRTFNQLFPFGHYYFGGMDLIGRQNIKDLNYQLGLFPTHWMNIWLQYHMLELANAKDALYNSAGVPTRRDPTGRAGPDVGDLLSLQLWFHLTNHQDVMLFYGHLYAGDFIKQTAVNPQAARSPDYVYMQYSFRW